MRASAIDGFSEDIERLRAALDASCIVGTWDWDHVRGKVVYDTGAARLLTGDPGLADQPISRPIAMAAVHPADDVWLMDHMQRAVRQGGLMLAEYRVFAEDGNVRWLLSRGRSYQDEKGQAWRSRGILMDITEVREDGERYVLTNTGSGGNALDRAASLGIALKQALGPEAPDDVRLAADLLLFTLGRALARSGVQ